MAANSFQANQGTQTNLLTDNTGGVSGTLIPVMKVSMDGQGTYTNANLFQGTILQVNNIGTLPNLPGGTITLSNPTGTTVTVDHGTITLSNPTGTTVQFNNGTLNVGTINTGTINTGTFVMPSGTLTVLPNLPQGSINVTAGTIATLGTMGTLGTALGIGVVTTVTNLSNGTIQNSGTVTGVGVVSVLTKGTISLGSVGGVDANAAAQTANPVSIGGTDSGGTVRTVLVDSTGAMKVSGASAGTFVNLTTGTLNAGTINLGTVVGKDANGAIQGGNPVAIAGTNATGNIVTAKVDSNGLVHTNLDTGTISVLPNLPQGSINVTAGTITAGSIIVTAGTMSTGTINIGTITGKDANAVAQTSNPVSIGGTDSGGTVRTVLVDSTGAMKVSGASAGTFVNLSTGTLNVGTVTLNGGTLNLGTVAGNLGTLSMLSAGTISSLPNLPQGSINVTAGTIGTVTNLGQVYNAGTTQGGTLDQVTIVNNLLNGTIQKLGTMITSSTGNITSVSDLYAATDRSIYKSFTLQIHGTFVGTINVQASNDNTNFNNLAVYDLSQGTVAPFQNITGTCLVGGRIDYTYLKVRMTSYTSGTATADMVFNSLPVGPAALGGLVNINNGTITTLAAGTINQLNAGSITVTAGTQSVGTINTGTINTGTFVMPSGTLTTGTILSSGTSTGVGTVTNLGSVTNLGQVYNAGTLQAGTINTGTFAMTVGTLSAGTIRDNYAAIGTMTITLGTLPTSGSVGRQSTLIDNTANLYQSAFIGVQITPGTVTAANTISYYLIRSDNGGGPIGDDNTGASDATGTWQNAPLIYTQTIGLGTNAQYKNTFDTGPYRLGPKWGLLVVHNLGNPLNATSGSHSITFQGIRGVFQ